MSCENQRREDAERPEVCTLQSVDIYELIRDLTVGDTAELKLKPFSLNLSKTSETTAAYNIHQEPDDVFDEPQSCNGEMSFDYQSFLGTTIEKYDQGFRVGPDDIYNLFLDPKSDWIVQAPIYLTIYTNIPITKFAGKE